MSKAIVGVFSYLDDALSAVEHAKQKGLQYHVYSPVPNHHLEEATMPQRSPVRTVSLIGAVTGLVAGFSLAIMCSLDWPLRVSAKDIVSIPGFVVIGYECTILFGALATLFAMFHFCRIPNPLRKIGYDPRFTYDKFGVVISCEPNETEQVKQALVNSGAEEVNEREGL